ncbi:MAG: hypothetical protein ACYCVN_11295 [Acidimicrobiales bacterium]
MDSERTPIDPLPLHRRSLDHEAFEAGDQLRIVGRLGDERPWARGPRHVWAEGGPAELKLAAGWRPGVGPCPAPLVADVVEESGG